MVGFLCLQYAAICKAILRDGPNIVAVLEKLDAKLENQMELVDSKVNINS